MPRLLTLSALATTFLLAGCLSTRKTPTIGQTVTAGVCDAWLAISFDSNTDTAETVTEIRANNAARAAFCD